MDSEKVKENPRVLVVIPPTRMHHNRDVGFKELLPHIGVAYVAAAFVRAGADVGVVDSPAEQLGLDDVMRRVSEFRPHVVGFTASTYQIHEAAGVARAVRERFPDARIILGGYHASALPERTLNEFPCFDMAFYGESEPAAAEYTGRLRNCEPVHDIDGTAARINGGVRLNPPAPRPEDLDALPLPAFDLMPLHRYRGFYSLWSRRDRPLTFCSARGCPFHCIFCFKSTGDRIRMQSVDSMMNEMKRDVEQLGATQIVFTDEIFTYNKPRIKEFCERMQQTGYNKRVWWVCQDRVDLADAETLRLMKLAGCTTVSYGIESGSTEILKSIKKNVNLEQAIAAIRTTREAGIWADTNFIIGHPGETDATVRETINFALSLNPDSTSFAILCPFPGTKVADMAKAGQGGLRLLSEDWSTYGKQVGEALELENMPRARLEHYHRMAYRKFYLRRTKWLSLFRVVNMRAVPMYLWHSLVVRFKRPKKK